MLGMLSAERTILAALKLFRSILLVLDGIVVSLLALFTSQSDFDSVVSHTFGTSYIICPLFGADICLPVWELKFLSAAIFARKKKPLLRQVIVTITQPPRQVKHFS